MNKRVVISYFDNGENSVVEENSLDLIIFKENKHLRITLSHF